MWTRTYTHRTSADPQQLWQLSGVAYSRVVARLEGLVAAWSITVLSALGRPLRISGTCQIGMAAALPWCAAARVRGARAARPFWG